MWAVLVKWHQQQYLDRDTSAEGEPRMRQLQIYLTSGIICWSGLLSNFKILFFKSQTMRFDGLILLNLLLLMNFHQIFSKDFMQH